MTVPGLLCLFWRRHGMFYLRHSARARANCQAVPKRIVGWFKIVGFAGFYKNRGKWRMLLIFKRSCNQRTFFQLRMRAALWFLVLLSLFFVQGISMSRIPLFITRRKTLSWAFFACC